MENRLVSVTVSGQTTQFVYDGDGNLEKKVNPDGSKTIYVGGIYEVDKSSGGSVTHTRVYYPVGGAMRVDGTLYYVLKDHLGSASVVTDAYGVVVGEQRYYPYGETRLSTGTMFTDKLYTGQREVTGLGIYHYGARFYSQRLGRFLSADTIIPSLANPQSLNRYMYVLGNPIRYNDPSGHKACDGAGVSGNCDQSGIPSSSSLGQIVSALKSYGVKVKGKWDTKHAYAAYLGVADVGDKLARTFGGSAESAFHKVFKNGVNFTWGGEGATGMCAPVTDGGCTSNASQINFWSMSNDMVKNVVHELGHAFYHAVGDPLLGNAFRRDTLIRNASYGGDEALVWEQHPISMNKDGKDIPTELFADTFIAWTYNTWNPSTDATIQLAVDAANSAMNDLVP